MLTLPIQKRWFDMILSGEKKEEYREIIFRNGYSKDSKAIKARCKLRIRKGRPEWGALPDKQYYILEILDKEELAASYNLVT